MFRAFVSGGLLALSGAAIAQSGEVSDTAGMTPPATAAPTADPTITVENSPERERLADKAVPPVVATTGEVKLAVDSEWWNFDKDRSGGLDLGEFGQMLYKFQKVAMTGPKTTEEAGKASAAAFGKADADKDGKVNRDEFVALLQSSAA